LCASSRRTSITAAIASEVSSGGEPTGGRDIDPRFAIASDGGVHSIARKYARAMGLWGGAVLSAS